MEIKDKVSAMRELLRKEYGIHNEQELNAALKKCSINIGMFVEPLKASKEVA